MPPDRLRAGDCVVDGDDYHYLFRVRRLAVGDAVELFDGEGRVAGAVVGVVGPERATLRVEPPRAAAEPCAPLTVVLALIKGERMDWAIQKLVELGASCIVPARTARSVVRLDGDRAARRMRRWRAIAADAARQCRRATMPDIEPVADWEAALASVGPDARRVVLWEAARAPSLAAALAGARGPVGIAVGPEGGFEPREVEAARAAGWTPVALGPRILRAETAAVAAAAIAGALAGDLGAPE